MHAFVLSGDDLSGSISTTDLLNGTHDALRMKYIITNGMDPDNFDFVVEGFGDINGDGFEDFGIGTPDAGDQGQGGFILVNGRADMDDLEGANPDMHAAGINGPQDVVASSAGDSLVGNGGNNHMSNYNGASAFGSVSFRGGAGNDTIELHGSNVRTIDGGDGYDILQLVGSGNSLNFSMAGPNTISGIEKLVMAHDNQTITLGLNDVFSLMQESDEIVGGRKVLKIMDQLGAGSTNTNFVVDAPSGSGPLSTGLAAEGFTAGGTHTDGSVTFNVYEFGTGYALLVDQTINGQTVI